MDEREDSALPETFSKEDQWRRPTATPGGLQSARQLHSYISSVTGTSETLASSVAGEDGADTEPGVRVSGAAGWAQAAGRTTRAPTYPESSSTSLSGTHWAL